MKGDTVVVGGDGAGSPPSVTVLSVLSEDSVGAKYIHLMSVL